MEVNEKSIKKSDCYFEQFELKNALIYLMHDSVLHLWDRQHFYSGKMILHKFVLAHSFYLVTAALRDNRFQMWLI